MTRASVFRANADMVLINATVLDRHYHPVLGLKPDDFRLIDERTEQQIKYFGEEDLPISLVVLFDASGSMRRQLSSTREAVGKLLTEIQAGDEFALVTLSDEPRLEIGWTENAAEVQNRLLSYRAHGRTPLFDAMQLGLKQFAKARNPRHAMVLLSDGGDNKSRLKEREMASILEEADVRLYAIDISDPTAMGLYLPEQANGGSVLERLCDRAGGRYFPVDSPRDLTSAVDRAHREIRSQYVLGYAPQSAGDDGRFHHVQVKLVRAKGRQRLWVYWRHGYRIPTN